MNEFIRPSLLSRVLLPAAKRLPRGSWPLTRWLAQRDPALTDYPVPLRSWPERIFRVDLREPAFQMFFRQGCIPHQMGEERILLSLIRPGDVVYDVGANVGYLTVLFCRAVGSSGHVHAFEPSPRAAELLRRSLLDSDPVTVHAVALGEVPGEVTFYEAEALNLSSISPPEGGRWQTRSHSVPITTLDRQLTDENVPSLIKIDVEGHEAQVLKGASELISRHTPLIFFEGLDGSATGDSIEAIRAAASDEYRFMRSARDGSLVGVDSSLGTNNFLAISRRHEDRVRVLPQTS